jgi:hypothetical protein
LREKYINYFQRRYKLKYQVNKRILYKCKIKKFIKKSSREH